MKKIFFISAALLGFFLLSFNSPATVIPTDDQVISWNDDSTKTVKSETSVKKETGIKEGQCKPSNCEKVCGSKSAKTSKSCCPKGGHPKKDPGKK